jgi:hypothetical protein
MELRCIFLVIIVFEINHFWMFHASYNKVHNLQLNIVSIKSACAMWKMLMVQNCDNDILEGLAVADPPQIQNPLFLSWRDWRL